MLVNAIAYRPTENRHHPRKLVVAHRCTTFDEPVTAISQLIHRPVFFYRLTSIR